MPEQRDEVMVEIQKQLSEVVRGNTRIEAKLDTHHQQLNDHELRLRELERKPGKRWDSLAMSVVTALVVGVIGYMLGKLL